MKKIVMMLALGLAVYTSGAGAQERINESRPARAGGTVEIHNAAGHVRVIGWDRNEVRVTGTLGRGAERLDFATEGNRTTIRVVMPRQGRNVRGTELEVRIPARSSPTVRTTSADIEISGVSGAVDVRSTSGGIRVGNGPSEIAAHSTSGGLDIHAERLGALRVGTVSGGIRLRGSSGSLDAESVSGSLDISVNTRQIRAKTVSGSLRLRDAGGSVEASTVSGSAEIEGGRFNRMSVSTVSGTLRFQGDLERGGLYHLNSHSGNLEMRLPANVAADFEVSTFSGRISNAFGPEPERGRGPGRELRFTSGRGGARVVAKTFSGDVRLVSR